MPRILNERAISSLVLLLIGLGLSIYTFGLNYAQTNHAFNPMFFPRILLVLWIALAASNALVDFVQAKQSDTFRLGRVVAISIVFVLYVTFLRELGFFFSSVLLSCFILVVLGIRSVIPIALVGVGMPLLITLLFNHLLKMPLPNSPFFWWI